MQVFSQRGGISIEYVLGLVVVAAVMMTPLNDSGLPEAGGKPVAERLADGIRKNHEAWVYAMSLPDAS